MREHEYRQTVLNSGLTVHTIKIPGAEKNHYEVLVKSGSAVESGTKGIAHYLEHMFGYGSADYSKKELLPYFSRVGGRYNFTTGAIFTNYHAHAFPHKTAEYAERIASVLSAPIFTPEHVELERGPILSEEMERRSQMGISPFFATAPVVYDNHSFSKPGIGTQEDIKAITYEDLREYYEAVYVASNIHVICVGDVEHDDIVKATIRQYDTMSQRPVTKHMEPLIARPGSHLGKMNSGGADINIGFVVPYEGRDHTIADKVAAMILGERLHASLRVEHNMVYAIEANVDSTSHEYGLNIRTNTNPSQLEDVLEKIFENLADTAHNLNDDDLDVYCANQEEFLWDVKDNVQFHGNRLSDRVMSNMEYSSPLQDYERAINISAADVRKSLVRMLGGKSYMAVAGPLEELPAIEKYVNKLRLDLGIDGIGISSNIKEEFNPKDP